MKTSINGRKMIESFEGCELEAYKDQRGIPTIGYGHCKGVLMGDHCTKEQADEWLVQDLAEAEHAVNTLVTAPLSQNQFDALVSLVFNIGSGNFAESTVRRKLNQGDVIAAANALLMWNKTGGENNPGLQRRRENERLMFLS